MCWLRRTCLTGLVWLTAGMTPLAGMSHLTCRCPNGRVKPFCFGLATNESGCCCGGECCTTAKPACPSARKAQVLTRCCCQQQRAARAALANDCGCFTATCCTKTRVGPKASVVSYGEKPVPEGPTVQAVLASQPMVSSAVPSAPCRFRREHQRPPPTDLVITLQHFLI